jgi:hypothetical protein
MPRPRRRGRAMALLGAHPAAIPVLPEGAHSCTVFMACRRVMHGMHDSAPRRRALPRTRRHQRPPLPPRTGMEPRRRGRERPARSPSRGRAPCCQKAHTHARCSWLAGGSCTRCMIPPRAHARCPAGGRHLLGAHPAAIDPMLRAHEQSSVASARTPSVAPAPASEGARDGTRGCARWAESRRAKGGALGNRSYPRHGSHGQWARSFRLGETRPLSPPGRPGVDTLGSL